MLTGNIALNVTRHSIHTLMQLLKLFRPFLNKLIKGSGGSLCLLRIRDLGVGSRK